jgi:ABC-type phosphate/phosphonate transport system ATPase subunit
MHDGKIFLKWNEKKKKKKYCGMIFFCFFFTKRGYYVTNVLIFSDPMINIIKTFHRLPMRD